MGLPHIKTGAKINLFKLNDDLPKDKTFALIKTEMMEVIRLVIPEGKHVPEHSVTGEITVQCLSGELVLRAGNAERELRAGDWLYLAGSQEHSLAAITDCCLLVTILLPGKAAQETEEV